MKIFQLIIAFVFITVYIQGQNKSVQNITVNSGGMAGTITIAVTAGKHFDYPTMAFWIEDLEGNYIQTLYVSKSLATGVYGHGDYGNGRWMREPGLARRPATLPYYLHKRNIQAPDGLFLPTPDNPIPDAYTGATPTGNFILISGLDQIPASKFRVLAEINQAFDWNSFWTNSLYPEDKDYKTSGQPAVVYAVTVDLNSGLTEFFLNPVGHSHYSGADGRLYTDLSTLTTALEIVKKIKVTITLK